MTPTAAALIAWVLGANPSLEEGRRLYDAMLYERAVTQLTAAADSPASTRAERREAVDLLARALSAQGRHDEAEREYLHLLGRDPNAPAPQEASPRLRAMFQRAKSRLYRPDFASLSPVSGSRAGVVLDLSDPWGRARAVWLFWAQGGGGYTREPMVLEDGRATGHFGALGPEEVRYYAAAVDERERPIATAGNERQPLSLSALETAPAPLKVDPPRAEPVLTPPPEPPPSQTEELVRAPAPEAPRRSYTPAVVVGSIAAAALIAGIALAASSQADASAANRPTTFASDADALNHSAWTKALVANIAIGGGILGGAGAGYLAWSPP